MQKCFLQRSLTNIVFKINLWLLTKYRNSSWKDFDFQYALNWDLQANPIWSPFRLFNQKGLSPKGTRVNSFVIRKKTKWNANKCFFWKETGCYLKWAFNICIHWNKGHFLKLLKITVILQMTTLVSFSEETAKILLVNGDLSWNTFSNLVFKVFN